MEKDKFWEYFDDDAKDYVTTIMETEGDFYKKSGNLVNEELKLGGVALDIGNGGIINYDVERLQHLDCADIYLNPRIVNAYKDVSNIKFIVADITDMSNIEDGAYDIVIVQNVIHHLAVDRYKGTYLNCVKAMNECMRVLNRGGKLIICESTVKNWFETMEKLFYIPMMKCCDIVKFDRVYQYSQKSLHEIFKTKLCYKTKIIREEDIGQGEYVLFLGRKIKSSMLPLTVSYFVIEKDE